MLLGSTRAASKAASGPHSPQTHRTPWRTCVGRVDAHDRALACSLGSCSSVAWGSAMSFPSPFQRHPWYEHIRVPSFSILPSLRGTFRWGQRSSKTRHSPSPSFQATSFSPRSWSLEGRPASMSWMTSIGYQAFFQLNFSPQEFSTSSAAVRSTSLMSAAWFRTMLAPRLDLRFRLPAARSAAVAEHTPATFVGRHALEPAPGTSTAAAPTATAGALASGAPEAAEAVAACTRKAAMATPTSAGPLEK
mmetsp:Transcript_48579/g.128365  ORF Transcript_48579/g.128365 Transcript_48579/m.128365 type:complete len:248 (-) Transcript_48579:63-806(-)